MSRKLLFLPWAAAALLAVASSAQADVIIVDPDAGTSLANTIWTGNVAGDRTTLFSGEITPGVAIPLTWSDPGNPSANHANATFTFGDSGFFISDIDSARTGGFAAQQHARIAFTVDAPTLFTFSGQYTNSNFADFSGRAFMQNALSDLTDFSGRAFMQNALSDLTDFSTPIPTTFVFSTSFAAGPVPLNIATVTGMLAAGHTYVWDTFVGSLASGNPAGSTVTGNMSLTFRTVTEPASLTLGILGIACDGLVLRRRK